MFVWRLIQEKGHTTLWRLWAAWAYPVEAVQLWKSPRLEWGGRGEAFSLAALLFPLTFPLQLERCKTSEVGAVQTDGSNGEAEVGGGFDDGDDDASLRDPEEEGGREEEGAFLCITFYGHRKSGSHTLSLSDCSTLAFNWLSFAGTLEHGGSDLSSSFTEQSLDHKFIQSVTR